MAMECKVEVEYGEGVMEDRNVALPFIIKELIGFLLFMNTQIPCMIESMLHKWENLEVDENGDDEASNDAKRRQKSSKRKASREKKKLEKFMRSFEDLLSAIRVAVQEVPSVLSALLVLGPSPMRARVVYEIDFSQSLTRMPLPLPMQLDPKEICKHERKIEILTKKIIRTLISESAGFSTSGPTKLFVLLKAPASSHMPSNFLPKRAFSIPRKIDPILIQLSPRYDAMCRVDPTATILQDSDSQFNNGEEFVDDLIWFLCKHSIKGLTSQKLH